MEVLQNLLSVLPAKKEDQKGEEALIAVVPHSAPPQADVFAADQVVASKKTPVKATRKHILSAALLIAGIALVAAVMYYSTVPAAEAAVAVVPKRGALKVVGASARRVFAKLLSILLKPFKLAGRAVKIITAPAVIAM